MQFFSPRARKRAVTALATASLSVSMLVPATGAIAQDAESYAHVVTSIAPDAIEIDIQVYRPAGASASNPVPVLLTSHGWGGSKASGAGSFATEQEAGFGVVSITQRGHGASGGLRTVEDPDLEGQDMIAVVDYIAGLDWVAQDELPQDGSSPFDNDVRNGDPVMGAWGGSYGGGFQYVLAMTEMRDFGATRMDAMAPDITWHNLNQALAPQDVPRSAWLTLLYATAANKVAPYISEGFAYGMATGQYSDGTVPGFDLKSEFATHGPAGYVDVEGNQIKLDIPMLISQGFTDNLFIFNEAWDNFHVTLTEDAQSRSQLIGYNGGHALPNIYPIGYSSGGEECGGTGTATRVNFFTAALVTGEDTRVVGDGETFQYTDASGNCLRLDYDDLDFEATYSPTELDPTGTLGPAIGTATMMGAPISLELASGPMTIAGVPELSADIYGLGYDQRVFFSLSVGTSESDARVIQQNMMPYRMAGPVPETGRSIDMRLTGVAETLEEGEKLFLTISPFSGQLFGHGSRTPGFVGFTDVEVTVPTVIAD